MGRKMSGETVNVKITLSGVEVWHKGAFIKRWKYWEYVLGIAVDYMIKNTCYSTLKVLTDMNFIVIPALLGFIFYAHDSENNNFMHNRFKKYCTYYIE